MTCARCGGTGMVSCPGPTGPSGARTNMERERLGLVMGIDYCYGMHMGHKCPECATGSAGGGLSTAQ